MSIPTQNLPVDLFPKPAASSPGPLPPGLPSCHMPPATPAFLVGTHSAPFCPRAITGAVLCSSRSSMAHSPHLFCSPLDSQRHLRLTNVQSWALPSSNSCHLRSRTSIILVPQAKIVASLLFLLFLTPHTPPLKIGSVQNPSSYTG